MDEEESCGGGSDLGGPLQEGIVYEGALSVSNKILSFIYCANGLNLPSASNSRPKGSCVTEAKNFCYLLPRLPHTLFPSFRWTSELAWNVRDKNKRQKKKTKDKRRGSCRGNRG